MNRRWFFFSSLFFFLGQFFFYCGLGAKWRGICWCCASCTVLGFFGRTTKIVAASRSGQEGRGRQAGSVRSECRFVSSLGILRAWAGQRQRRGFWPSRAWLCFFHFHSSELPTDGAEFPALFVLCPPSRLHTPPSSMHTGSVFAALCQHWWGGVAWAGAPQRCPRKLFVFACSSSTGPLRPCRSRRETDDISALSLKSVG